MCIMSTKRKISEEKGRTAAVWGMGNCANPKVINPKGRPPRYGGKNGLL